MGRGRLPAARARRGLVARAGHAFVRSRTGTRRSAAPRLLIDVQFELQGPKCHVSFDLRHDLEATCGASDHLRRGCDYQG
jgi:hypothetical protein